MHGLVGYHALHQFYIKWGEEKEENSGTTQEVMEYVPTITYGKQKKRQ
jgi:hypothetical protein